MAITIKFIDAVVSYISKSVRSNADMCIRMHIPHLSAYIAQPGELCILSTTKQPIECRSGIPVQNPTLRVYMAQRDHSMQSNVRYADPCRTVCNLNIFL